MKYGNYRDGFFLPNELFQLGLDYGELAVYSFLKRCENRKTHQCWPSIKREPKDASVLAQHQNDWASGGYEREHGAQVHPPAGGARSHRHGIHRGHYQLIGRVRSPAFQTFCTLSGPECHPFRHSCVRYFRPLVSPCGSRCGSEAPDLLQKLRQHIKDNGADHDPVGILIVMHQPVL